MTCIVGVVRDGVVYLGADSQATAGWNASTRKDKKLFRLGEAVMGVAGSPRARQLIEYGVQLPIIPQGDFDLFRWMVVDLSEAIRKCWREGGYLQKVNERESGEGTSIIVGIRGRLFTICQDLQVEEVSQDYAAIGSGENFALGSLYRSMAIGEKVESAIISALMAAEEFSIGVRGPFHIISTKGDSHD